MDNVVSIEGGKSVGFIGNVAVPNPKTGQEYLDLCKKFLTVEDYEEVLLCIMDESYYNDTDKAITDIVDCYYSFHNV